MAASYVSEELVSQQSRDELALVGDSRGEDRAIEDVVLQQGSQQSLVGSQRCKCLVVDLGEGFVRGRKDGDILRATETLDQRTKTGKCENTTQAAELTGRVQGLGERWDSAIRLSENGTRKSKDGELGKHSGIQRQVKRDRWWIKDGW